MTRKLVRPPKPPKPEKVAAPPYMRDIIWPQDEDDKPPLRKYGGGLTKRDLALFMESREFDWEVLKAMVKKLHFKMSDLPHEPWRSLMIKQMRLEVGSGPVPKWLDLKEYHKVRMLRLGEEEPEPIVYPGEDGYYKEKKPTRRDIIDAKYNVLITELKRSKENA